jgi:hypothetical protein
MDMSRILEIVRGNYLLMRQQQTGEMMKGTEWAELYDLCGDLAEKVKDAVSGIINTEFWIDRCKYLITNPYVQGGTSQEIMQRTRWARSKLTQYEERDEPSQVYTHLLELLEQIASRA